MTYYTLTPAYGRDYRTAKDAKADFEAGNDFILNSYDGNGLINKEQLNRPCQVNIRFAKQAKLTVVKLIA